MHRKSYVEESDSEEDSKQRTRSKRQRSQLVVEDEASEASEEPEERLPTRSRRGRGSSALEQVHPNGGRTRRSSRLHPSERSEDAERLHDLAQHRRGRASASQESSSEEEGNEEESDEGDDSRQDRKYSPRLRVPAKVDNISKLGGDGGGLSRSRKDSRSYDRVLRDLRVPSYKEPRMRFCEKIPNGSPQPRSHHRHRRREYRKHFDSSSESECSRSSDSEPDEDRMFRRHERKRLRMELESVQPINAVDGMGGSVRDRISARDVVRADATPLGVDPSINFDSIGGLDQHVRALKEMVVLPLLYPDVFEKFDTQPPRGVLFVGPPGTGKTLTARALANSVSSGSLQGSRKVSFFMRKGADCLSKWVGEGERQLRLLFEQARRHQPSIIFFDEIDGLAPVRSVKQDQIHASIVSTLLALMDGLDSRGQVVVIGATNRPDAIDPALRRPGRFDRELAFPLPDAKARAAILQVHTSKYSEIDDLD